MPLPFRQHQRIQAAQLGIPPWQAVPMPQGGINSLTGNTQGPIINQGNGTPAFQWRYWPVLNAVELVGSLGGPISSLNLGLGPAAGSPVLSPASPWRLPYPPATAQDFAVICQGNTAGSPGSIHVDTSGLLTWNSSMPASVQVISFHVFIPLDA